MAKVPVNLASGKGSPPGLQNAAFMSSHHLCVCVELPGGSFFSYKDTNSIRLGPYLYDLI